MAKKAIVIHPNPAVHSWVGNLKPDWDVQIPVTASEQVWDLLQTGELSSESEILFISDQLFAENPDEFSVVAASFAPTLLVIITVEDKTLMKPISEAISQAVTTYELGEGTYYFFDTAEANPVALLDKVVAQYSQATAPAVASAPAPAPAPAPDLETYDPLAPAAPAPAAPAAPAVVPADENAYAGYTPEEIAQIENNLGTPGLIVASTSSKGGSGKTTTALCTAITISMASRLASESGSGYPPLKVCVVDMDVRDGQIGLAINQTSPSILTLYVSETLDIPTIKKHIISVPRFEIDTLLAPKRGKTADYLTPQFYIDVLHNLRLMYDLVILDTSVNYLDPLLRQVVYPEADAILFVTNLSKGAVLGMPRWLDEVTSTEEGDPAIEKDKIGVVINQSLGGVGMDLDLVKRAAKGSPLLVAIPSDVREVTKASNEGTLNDLIRKNKAIGEEYFKLARKVWRKTPLKSPVEDYMNSPEKQRDDALAAKGQTHNPNAVSDYTPLKDADPPKRRFGRNK